jgi:arylsulfatase A-like enzyme
MRVHLRALALALGLSLLSTATTAQSPSAPSPSPLARLETPATAPDIILIVVDDLGYLPDDRVLERLPNIRDLWLEGGLRFTEMHDESPLCGPSRASILTGKHTLHHGMVRNSPRGFDESETIAVALDDAGYETAVVGRYLNRYDGSEVGPGWDHAFIQRDSDRASFWRDGKPVRFRGQERDDVIRSEAIRQVRRAPLDQPFFAWVGPGAPHAGGEDGPQQSYEPEVIPRDQGARECRNVRPARPPTYRTRANRREVRGMPDWPRGWRLRRICESLLVVDRTVRGLVAAQARRGRDAIFVFTSDNGMAWGQKGFSLKHTPPATRSPFYVAGTGVVPGSTDALVSKIDVAPTLAELAGTSLPWADGQSLVPELRGAGAADGRAVPSEHLEVMPRSNARSYIGWNGLRTPERRFVRWDDGHRELYDLVADPWQARDLIDELPDVAQAMEARLDELLAASGGEEAPVDGADQGSSGSSRAPSGSAAAPSAAATG